MERTKRHQLLDILVIAVCTVMCGANTWVGVENFSKVKVTWLRQFLTLPNGLPSHDTFGDVFACLNPTQFQTCFLAWVQALIVLASGQVVAIDGKTLHRLHNHHLGKDVIRMVRA